MTTQFFLFAVVLIWSALYLWERAVWSLGPVAENRFKTRFASHAVTHLAALEDQLVAEVREQASLLHFDQTLLHRVELYEQCDRTMSPNFYQNNVPIIAMYSFDDELESQQQEISIDLCNLWLCNHSWQA